MSDNGTTPIEITIKVKGSDSVFRKKFLEYRPIKCDPYDPVIEECIKDVRDSYSGEVEDIDVTVKFTV